jgi:DNA polymerase-3 subunit beta
MTTDAGVENFAGVIVPRAMIDHLLKVLPKKSGTLIRFEMNDSRVKVTSGRAVLMSKTIDGTFPDYARVIPQHNESIVRFDRKAFIDGLKLVKSVADSRSFTVQLSKAEAYGAGDVLQMVVTSPDKGVARTQIAGQFSGPLMPEIGFDAAYMAEILSGSLDGAEIEVALGDSGCPAVWRDAARPQGGFVVLMPRRI